MNEFAKTGIVAGVAVLLAIVAGATSPRAIKAGVFDEQGQAFFPDFKDPFTATSLQVVDYDATASAPTSFKVEFKNGKWTIPSHHDYPADGKDRLAKTATGVMGLRKEKMRTDRKEDHAVCGVIDPEDSAASDPKDRGRRVTLRDAAGQVLADLIVGRKADDGGKRYFVRVPGQKRVYDVKMDADLSTKFADWIETDLTKIDPASIWQITLDNYAVVQNGNRFKIENEAKVDLQKDKDTWTTAGLTADESIDAAQIGTITATIDKLEILGVRKKTEAMARFLRGGSNSDFEKEDMLDLVDKGFIPTERGLLSKEGNLIAVCEDGVVYELRFGTVFTGSGLDLTAGGEGKKDEKKDEKKDKPATGTEARYLMIVVEFAETGVKPEKLADPPKSPLRISTKPWSPWRIQQAAEDARKVWARARLEYDKKRAEANKRLSDRKDAGKKRAKELGDRFADWFYVIGADAFTKLHVKREDVVKSKKEPVGPKLPPDPEDHGDHDDVPGGDK